MQDDPALGPRTIRLETPHYVVRTIEPSDANESWQHWMEDPAAARNLNALPNERTADQIRDYIQRFDRITAHLLGIFDRMGPTEGRLVGIRAIYVDPKSREFIVNVLIGEADARNKGARTESRDVMYRYFFETMGLACATCSVMATNAAVLKVMDDNGWILSGRAQKPAASGSGFVELRQFRLPREVWAQKEAEKARLT